MNEQFNWYKKPTGTQRYTTLTCVQAGKKISEILDYITYATNIKHNEKTYTHKINIHLE